MNPSLNLILTLECELCGQYIIEESVYDTCIYEDLFGAKRYAICPCCYQENVTKMNDRDWQKRVNEYIRDKDNKI